MCIEGDFLNDVAVTIWIRYLKKLRHLLVIKNCVGLKKFLSFDVKCKEKNFGHGSNFFLVAIKFYTEGLIFSSK